MKVDEFTGENHLNTQQFAESTVLVATPEKWDVISRKSLEKDNIDNVSLMIIDEIHLIGDYRGPVLESLIMRQL